MDPLWTSVDAVAATGGQSTGDWQAHGISIDAGSLFPGDLFLALPGSADGHDFVAAALAKGAAAALVSHRPSDVDDDAPLLIVPDVGEALFKLAAAARARTRARVIAVTGSVGKTSTREMLRVVLGGQGSVHVGDPGGGRDWGVPLTLASLPAATDFAVIEIGAHKPGEIAPLAGLSRPDLVLITTVAEAHLQAFKDVDGVAGEIAQVLDSLEPGGHAVLPADLAVTPILQAKAVEVGAQIAFFGATDGAAYQLGQVVLAETATIVRATRHGQPMLFKVRSPGRHYAMNALGVLAAADVLGCDATIAACDIGRWLPTAGSGGRERITLDIVDETGFDLIADAADANPASLAADIEMLTAVRPEHGLGRIGAGRRIAVLGDMADLGGKENALHEAIARLPQIGGIDVVHCVGPRMRALWQALPRAQRGEWVESSAELAPRARHLVDAGDIVLIAGSRGSRLGLIVDVLRKLGQGQPAPIQGAE